MAVETKFTWVPTHQKIVKYLVGKERHQGKLIELLKEIGVTKGFDDKDKNDQTVELSEIDPFTFFCFIYKYGDKNRLKFLRALAEKLEVSPLPTDVHGLPSANALKVWLFPWKKNRRNNEIKRLWNFFYLALSDKLDDEVFADVLSIHNVKYAKLTEALFYILPEKYLPINGPTKFYLEEEFEIKTKFKTYKEYRNILRQVADHSEDPFYKISDDACYYYWGNDNELEYEESLFTGELNQILYGPPGTGKTYHTVNRALEILGVDTEDMDRYEIKALFDVYLEEGRIVFTTFHQSMCYEDFIEGIKPQEPEQECGSLTYRVEDGIFKRLCTDAAFALIEEYQSEEINRILEFSDRYDQYVEELADTFSDSDDSIQTVTSKSGGSILIEEINSRNNIVTRRVNSIRRVTVSKERLAKLNEAFPDLDTVTNIQREFNDEIGGSDTSVYWAVLNDFRSWQQAITQNDVGLFESNPDRTTDTLSYVERAKIVRSLSSEDFAGSEYVNKPHVLIIDEINRGNVSQIFGELITLIEENKRLGNVEALTATLPYSKEKFGVPPNVYIIGTMNTADRSVEALDAALRRRFSFSEMPPQPNLITPLETLRRFWIENEGLYGETIESYKEYEKDIQELLCYEVLDFDAYMEYGDGGYDTLSQDEFDENIGHLIVFHGINLSHLLSVINKRIEKLLDHDHLIGHSYFMEVFSIDDLKAMFQNKIIPLLQEYFYGDYGKIGLVLGKGFFENDGKQNNETQTTFADFEGYDPNDYLEKPIYRLKNVVEMSNEKFSEAIMILLPPEL